MKDCLFCKLAEGDSLVYQDDKIVAFKDINPQAPTHILIIPKQHIATLNDTDDVNLLGSMILVAKQLAAEKGISESGYRTIFNCNKGGGQEVFHIHLHLLGGRQLSWPPG